MGFRGHIDVSVRCTCTPSPILGALFHLQGQWWWWPIIAKDSVLETIKREGWMAAVRSGTVTDADAVALGFARGIRPANPVSAEEALHRKTGPFHWRPTTKGWLRACPACGCVPEISRKALYTRAFAAVDRHEATVYL